MASHKVSVEKAKGNPLALYHFTTKPLSRGTRNTVGAVAYRAGCKLVDEQTGETFDYRSKAVQHVELVLPADAPQWAINIQKLVSEDRQKGVQAFVDIVEGSETRINSRVWREFEFALHRELTEEQNMGLSREFVQDQICSRGMAAQLNFHFDKDEDTGEEKPHCHVVVTTRRLEETGMGAKERDWNQKELLCDLREKWQEYSNLHLKLHGHDVQIDHRSNKERGIEMEPQPKRGRNIIEQERRLQKLEGTGEGKDPFSPLPFSPLTDKAKAFHDVQLRNLYRIMRQLEVVFDIVTKHHATFMWADVQKVLHRYMDEVPLFQRLEVKLKGSNELIALRGAPDSEEKTIYTTRTMLKAERSLVEKAEVLGKNATHPVQKNHSEGALTKANKTLEKHGGLSADQVKAIYHLVEEGQLKCVVGIAGAGKTTALGVCQEIWKAEGYNVYGLTPTGKAAQNLEDSGISSMTLHKFLKSFEEGRCQYNGKSVLVLDEAGMVDVERFEKLLAVVQQLGVKLIVVGDGAQLQPVEAGPAFRLVTDRLGKSELNTVLRQKEGWQKEATLLFGQQKTAEALQRYMDKGHVHLIDEKLPSAKDEGKVDIRHSAKKALVQAWHADFKESPEKSFLILAHTNRDVKDLNALARSLLKDSGQLSKKEFTFIIKKEDEDDFGKKRTKREEKGFSKGDRIVFTRNNYGLGVKNGSIGTILDLNKKKVKVQIDEGKDLSFAPTLNPYFDQGWAITIHKSQGTTVDKSYVLASSSMTQNLSYVAMTRHREDVQVFGSLNEFQTPEHLSQQLSKSGEKLSAGDYLDAESLHQLMKQDDHHITKLFTRLSNELEAIGAVSKRAFWQVADHFLGMNREKEIRISDPPQGVREEVRAQEVLKKEGPDSQKVFENLTKSCEAYLYKALARDNVPLTPEKRERIPRQAERAATYIFFAHTLKGTEPTDKETRLYLLRAKYELNRIPQIKESLTNKWEKEGHFDGQKDPLIIHMMADRQASIEGRLYWEDKREGITPSPLIPDHAAREFKEHRDQTKSLASTLSQDHSLSEKAATHCAKDMLRYQETHGEKPTQSQVSAMVQISRELEKSFNAPSAKNIGSHKLEYMRRMEGDGMLRDKGYDERNSIKQERALMHAQEKAALEAQRQCEIQQEVSRQKDRGFEMEM